MSPVTLRRWHSYIGLFIAPSVLFFAVTGAYQLFSLHEAHGDYRPPVFLERLSTLHKDQVLEKHKRERPVAQVESAQSNPDHAHDNEHENESPRSATVLLKTYFLIVALGLTASTCLGIWMGFKASRRTLSLSLLALGTLLPIALVLI